MVTVFYSNRIEPSSATFNFDFLGVSDLFRVLLKLGELCFFLPLLGTVCLVLCWSAIRTCLGYNSVFFCVMALFCTFFVDECLYGSDHSVTL